MTTLFLVTAVFVTLGLFWPESASAPCGDCGRPTGQTAEYDPGYVDLCSGCFAERFRAMRRARGVK